MGNEDAGTRGCGDTGTRGCGDAGTEEHEEENSQFPIPKTQLLLYLIPIIGFFPSLWTLYRRRGSREQLNISRLSITLALTWLLGYFLLGTGAATSDFFTLRVFVLNSFLTSGYFLVSVWLMFRLIQGKSKRLPGFSSFAQRILSKYLA
jgi:hypothetical protein